MRKQRKILAIVLGVFCGLALLDVILFVCGCYSIWAFLALLVPFVATIGVLIWRIVLLTKKLKIKLLEASIQNIQVQNPDDPTAIYKALGIPVRYDDTGRVLSIYELLGLVPIYDKNGKRVKTIYEELDICPKFNSEGKERPSVVIIKNRVGKIAKVKSANHKVFVRKLTPEQKEALILINILKKKQEEAEEQKDKEKAEKIKKAINTVKAKAKPKAASKPAKTTPFKMASAKGAEVKMGKAKPVSFKTSSLFDYISSMAKKPAPVIETPKVELVKNEQPTEASEMPPNINRPERMNQRVEVKEM